MSQSKNTSAPQSLANFDSLPDAAFVRVGTVAGLFDCSVITVWRKAKDGTIPKPKKLSARVTGWNVGQLRATLKTSEV